MQQVLNKMEPAISLSDSVSPLCLALYFRGPNGIAASSVRANHFIEGMTQAGWKVALACSYSNGFSKNGLYDLYQVKRPFSNGAAWPGHTQQWPGISAWPPSPDVREGIRRAMGSIKPWIPFPDKSWWFLRYKELEEWACSLSPDLIFSSSPPPAMHILASRLSRKLGVPWVAELRDLWSQNFFEHKRGVLRSLDRALEYSTLSGAKGLVTVSPPLADNLWSRYQKPVEVIYPSFKRTDPEAADQSKALISAGLPLRLLYSGRVYPRFQAPEILCQALQRLLQREVVRPAEIVVDFYCHNHMHLQRWFAKNFPGLMQCCRVHAPITHQEILLLQQRYHALLHIGWFDKEYEGCVTSKFFEYLGAGRPILSTAKPGSWTKNLLRQTGAGHTVSTPGQCATVLRGWVEDLREKKSLSLQDSVAAKVSEFSYTEQTAKLSRFLLGFLQDPTH